jgi:pilus assembly protein CpaE
VIAVTVASTQNHELADLLRQSEMQVSDIDLGSLANLTAPSARQPDVLVVDLRGEEGLPAAIAVLRRQHPQTGIVIVAPTLDPNLLLHAMRAGVNEVVTDPVTLQDLEKAVYRVVGERQVGKAGRVFAIVGAKGGVGTTTVAVNVATVLGAASKPGRTLLMDLHRAGGDAAVFLGVEPRFSILDALENTHRLDATFLRSVVTQVAPCVDLLASPDRPASGPSDTVSIRTVIDFVAASYKYTVIDLPRADGAVLDALDLADKIVVVANQELATVKSASRLSAALRHRYGREKVTVVLSRLDRRAEIVNADVERVIGFPLAHMFPSDYRAALHALNKGRPLTLGNYNELASSFKRFALSLAGVHPDRDSTPRVGLLGRLTQRGA